VRICTAIAQQLAQAIALARTQAELVGSREQTVERLAAAVALRDGETGAHTQRMSAICGVLAGAAGLPRERCEVIRIASAMHDIGKVATPDAILHKPGPLTAAERAEINRHAEIGHKILAGSGSELLEVAAEIALSHHERWDGDGYPRGVSGPRIPLAGRIAALADVYDALTSDRPYRDALPVADALDIMRAGRGTHFDPELLDRFVACIGEVLAVG
jgi:putative two-component system response regulator